MDALNHLPSFYMSANSPSGFFSYCDDIINMKTRNRMYILKGGPGTGKSSLMKKIASSLSEEGHDIELIYCSSDPDSLDGILIKDLNIIFVDGTAPHAGVFLCNKRFVFGISVLFLKNPYKNTKQPSQILFSLPISFGGENLQNLEFRRFHNITPKSLCARSCTL